MATTWNAGRRTSLAEAIENLDRAAHARLVCLGAEGFWLVDGGVQPSLDHILDLSDVSPRNPRTNASIAKATIENWPDNPARFAVELVMVSIAHPCPCCGHLTFGEPPGSYSICPVCFWEDDAVQLRWPTMPGGANRPSLVDGAPDDVPTTVFDEVVHRTPGFAGWQQERWLFHCSDAAAFLGEIGYQDLAELPGVVQPLIADGWPSDVLPQMSADGDLTGYLFRCLHCETQLAYADAS